MRLRLLAASLLSLPLLACAGADPDDGPSPYDDDYPVSSYDPLFEGAPDNRMLPDENKADAIYPRQYTELLREQSPVKSQGSRGVCSIFATAALMENLYIKAGKPDADFSEQYLQWSAKEQVRSFRNTEGSNADSNLRAISDYGIVEEALWRYQSRPWGAADDAACTGGENLPTKCYTNGAPPQEAVDGKKWKLPRGRWLNTNSIKAHLTTKKHGVTVGMTFFYQAWNHRSSTLPINTQYWREGIVLYPNAKDQELSLAKRAGHAIHIVGWDDDKEVAIVDETGAIVKDASGNPVTEKGFWIFKNSWGTGSFGAGNPHGDGYGYLSMKYVAEYGTAYVSDVPRYEAPVEACDNGTDDDGDGQVDCDDSECATHAACQASPTERTYAATPALAIPDNTPAGVSHTITVPDAGTVGTVAVTLDISHTYRGDLKVVLAHGGQSVTLHDRTGSYEDDLKLTVDAAALAGTSLAGDWTLTVSDAARLDTGTLNAWSIAVVTQ
ncbi:MAG TPA: proprotein convertase P-domain-containing protein [Kofleriaceae bacterium]|nr:proprotein convertase P-domain-containing protein [Kofleriaceae bacterium]